MRGEEAEQDSRSGLGEMPPEVYRERVSDREEQELMGDALEMLWFGLVSRIWTSHLICIHR
jgi:hypothetical protein